MFHALEQLDFRQKSDSGKLTPYGQEFSFFPGRPLGVPLRELEVVFMETQDELRMLAELDLAQPGPFSQEVERKAEIIIPREMLDEGKEEELARFLMGKIETFGEELEDNGFFGGFDDFDEL